MLKTTLKKFLTPLAMAAAMLVPMKAMAADYNFVRITGLAEQAVGERLLTEIYKRAGLKITITAMPGKRAIEEASSGRKDGETLRIFALGENEPRLIRVPTPLSDLQTAAFRKTGSDVAAASKDDLRNTKNVIVTGVLHTHAITEGLEHVNEVRDPSAMFRLVQAGRADLALTSSLDGRANLARDGITDIELIEPTLKTLQLYHYVHVSKADIVPTIDAIVKEMKDSGELAELRAKFEAEYIAKATQG